MRHGPLPALTTHLDDFELRRVSVSLRHVPEAYIHDLADLGEEARAIALPYVEQLAEHSAHFAAQLAGVSASP